MACKRQAAFSGAMMPSLSNRHNKSTARGEMKKQSVGRSADGRCEHLEQALNRIERRKCKNKKIEKLKVFF